MIDLKRTLYLVVVPALLAGLAIVFTAQLEPVSHRLAVNLPFIPYTVFLIGLVLTWIFNSHKEFILLAIVALAFFLCEHYIASYADRMTSSHKDILFSLLTITIPVNFIIFNQIKERGLLNRYGLRRVFFIIVQALALYFITFYASPSVTDALFAKPFLLPYFTHMPQLAVILFLIAIVSIIFHMILQPTVLQSGQLATLLFIGLALHNIDNSSFMQLNFTLAGLMLLFAVLLHSYNLAYNDELTGLPARRAMKQYLLGLGDRYTLAMVDVDNFKKLNDNYGHDVGDQVLRKLSKALKNAPGNAKAFRYGGEEFTIVYANKDLESAADYAEQLRRIIADEPFVLRNAARPAHKPQDNARNKRNPDNLNFSVSIGLAEYRSHHHSAMDTLKQADKALYAAKRKGRNCVVKAKRG